MRIESIAEASLLAFSRVATQLAVGLGGSPPEELDEALERALDAMGRYARAQRAYIFTIDRHRSVWCYDYEWCAAGISSQIDQVVDVPLDLFSGWLSRFEAHEAMHIPCVSDLPDSREREILEAQEILSLVALPMVHGDQLLGFVGFDAVGEPQVWTEEHRALLQLACDLVGGALSNRRFRRELLAANTRLQETNERLRAEAEQRRRTEELLGDERDKLAAASREIRELSGLLPICSSCKKIRDDKGYWQQVEVFLRAHSGKELTHGICPDCAARLYPEYAPFRGASSSSEGDSGPT